MLTLVSAREMYKKEYPNNESEWKKLAFANLAKKLNKNTFLNLIVIGDSSAEHEAGKHLKSLFKNCLLKQVKIQRLESHRMIQNLSKINSKFEAIFRHEEDMKISLH